MQIILTKAELHYLAFKQLNLEADISKVSGIVKLTTPHSILETGHTVQYDNGMVSDPFVPTEA